MPASLGGECAFRKLGHPAGRGVCGLRRKPRSRGKVMLPCLGLIFLSGTSAEWAMGQTEGNEGRREAHARLLRRQPGGGAGRPNVGTSEPCPWGGAGGVQEQQVQMREGQAERQRTKPPTSTSSVKNQTWHLRGDAACGREGG